MSAPRSGRRDAQPEAGEPTSTECGSTGSVSRGSGDSGAAGAGALARRLGTGDAVVIAYCNAGASAQLAAVYPTSGGTYISGRERLGHWWGFTAGWGFVVGKTASCSPMALNLRLLLRARPLVGATVAVAVVLGSAALNYRGICHVIRDRQEAMVWASGSVQSV